MNLSKALKNGGNFLKKNPEVIWSVLLMFIVPTLLFLNIFFAKKSFNQVVDSFKQEIGYNLSIGDLIMERVIEIFASDSLSKPEFLQKKLEEIIKRSDLKMSNKFEPAITKIKIETYENDQFKTVAEYPKEEKEKTPEADRNITETESEQLIGHYKMMAWSQSKDESVAFESFDEEGTQFRNLVKTVYDSSGKKVGLITMTTSLKYPNTRLKEYDKKMGQINYQLILFFGASALISVFLLWNHTKLFSYSGLYNKVREVDKMKDEFISMTAHELRTPITAIRGYADILKSEIGSTLNEAQLQHLSRVIISSERLNDLINDILDVSRIEQGRISMELQEVSPSKIIKETIDELKVKADEKGLQLIFEPKEEPYLISADPARLKQVLINIIGNSIKYTLKGKVEIETKAEELKGRGKYSIAIKDTGLGMSAEAQKKLFEKFYRVKTKDTTAISGTGLGLWITKSLTEKMEGEIFLESMEGVGSKFTIVFPLLKKVVTAQVPPSQAPK